MFRRILIVAIVLAVGRTAAAQAIGGSGNPVRFNVRSGLRYQNPASASPWLNLYRRDPGPLGSYLSNVRPEKQLGETLRRQQASIQRQNASLWDLDKKLTSVERGEAAIHPTGIGGGFMNYLHYFGQPQSVRRRR